MMHPFRRMPPFEGRAECERWMLLAAAFPVFVLPLTVRNEGASGLELGAGQALGLSFAMMMLAALPVMALRSRLLAERYQAWEAMPQILLWFPFVGFVLATFFPDGGQAFIPWLLFLPPWAVSYTGMRAMWGKAPRGLAVTTSRLLFMMLVLTLVLQGLRYLR